MVYIEDLKFEDIDAVYSLNKKVFNEAYDIDEIKELYNKIHNDTKTYRFLVAKKDDKVVGYTSCSMSYIPAARVQPAGRLDDTHACRWDWVYSQSSGPGAAHSSLPLLPATDCRPRRSPGVPAASAASVATLSLTSRAHLRH